MSTLAHSFCPWAASTGILEEREADVMSLRTRVQDAKEASRALEDAIKQERRAREDVEFQYTALQDTNAGLAAENAELMRLVQELNEEKALLAAGAGEEITELVALRGELQDARRECFDTQEDLIRAREQLEQQGGIVAALKKKISAIERRAKPAATTAPSAAAAVVVEPPPAKAAFAEAPAAAADSSSVIDAAGSSLPAAAAVQAGPGPPDAATPSAPATTPPAQRAPAPSTVPARPVPPVVEPHAEPPTDGAGAGAATRPVPPTAPGDSSSNSGSSQGVHAPLAAAATATSAAVDTPEKESATATESRPVAKEPFQQQEEAKAAVDTDGAAEEEDPFAGFSSSEEEDALPTAVRQTASVSVLTAESPLHVSRAPRLDAPSSPRSPCVWGHYVWHVNPLGLDLQQLPATGDGDAASFFAHLQNKSSYSMK